MRGKNGGLVGMYTCSTIGKKRENKWKQPFYLTNLEVRYAYILSSQTSLVGLLLFVALQGLVSNEPVTWKLKLGTLYYSSGLDVDLNLKCRNWIDGD